MTPEIWRALAARCESEPPSAELDEAIGRSMFNQPIYPPIQRYTRSWDAAIALLPPGAEIEITTLYGIAMAQAPLNAKDGPQMARRLDGDVPPTIAAAALRAWAEHVHSISEAQARQSDPPEGDGWIKVTGPLGPIA